MADPIAPYDHPEGARDREGRFEPFYVPRPIMPQIDVADYPALMIFLFERNVLVKHVTCDPRTLRFHQRVSEKLVRRMSPEQEAKPILISSDLYVLDGNHREERHLEDGSECACIRLGLPFGEAIDILLAFPGCGHVNI